LHLLVDPKPAGYTPLFQTSSSDLFSLPPVPIPRVALPSVSLLPFEQGVFFTLFSRLTASVGSIPKRTVVVFSRPAFSSGIRSSSSSSRAVLLPFLGTCPDGATAPSPLVNSSWRFEMAVPQRAIHRRRRWSAPPPSLPLLGVCPFRIFRCRAYFPRGKNCCQMTMPSPSLGLSFPPRPPSLAWKCSPLASPNAFLTPSSYTDPFLCHQLHLLRGTSP